VHIGYVASIFYVKRNNNVYAYESVSKRVPGRKNPVTEKTYLGKVDPETGEIIPKKGRGLPKKVWAKEYGSVFLLDHIQKELNLREHLNASFDSLGDKILAVAMAQAIEPTALMDTHLRLEDSFIPELLDLRGGFESQRMSELTKNVGEDGFGMALFFDLRMTKDMMYAYDLTSVSSHSHVDGWAEWGHNRESESLKQLNVGMVTDAEGIPTMFELFPGSVADMATLRRIIDDVQRHGAEGCRLVMDRGFESAGNILSLLDCDMSFVMPAKVNTKAVKRLLTRSNAKAAESMIHDGHAYRVLEDALAIKEEKGVCSYLTDEDHGFANAAKVAAFVCYDSEKASEDEQRLMLALNEIERKLNGKRFRRPEKTFSDVAGVFEKYLDFSLDDKGIMSVERKRNAMTFAANRAGTFVLLTTPGISWQEAMSSYDLRGSVEQAFDAYKNDLDGARLRTGDPERARGRMFIKFIALIMRSCISNVLATSEIKDITVDNSLRSLGNLRAVGGDGAWQLTELTARNRKILEAFGIGPPKSEDL